MKKIYNYTFQLVCVYILALSIFSILSIHRSITSYKQTVHNVDKEKVLNSTLLTYEFVDEMVEEEEKIKVEEQPEEIKEEVAQQAPVETQNLNIVDTSNYAVLSSEVITMSHYGHDCSGCGNQTASGYYIGDGRRYYTDNQFGSVRIVAADSKYPKGTIIRLTYNGNSLTAIVLDRGGGIGDHAKYQIDLLESSEAIANSIGVNYGVTLEVLRYGY